MSALTELLAHRAYAASDRIARNSDIEGTATVPLGKCGACQEDYLTVNEDGLCRECAKDEEEVGL